MIRLRTGCARRALHANPLHPIAEILPLNRGVILSYERQEQAVVADLARVWPQLVEFPPAITDQVKIDAGYAVYLDRQAADVASYRRDESLALPDDIDYAAMQGLSMEVRQKLTSIRPRTIGQAQRIDGMTPAALTLLLAMMRKTSRRQADLAG